MIYRLYPSDASTLLSKPETGMGYQIVNASQFGKTDLRNFIVYNSELAVDLDSNFLANKRRIIQEGFKRVLSNSTELMLETKSIHILERSSLQETISLSATKRIYNKRSGGGKGATDNPKENANGEEIFVRVSAFEDDKRIDTVNKKLKNGSYTTTEKDYNDCVSTNDDPIDRYALPNDDEIKWAFYIRQKKMILCNEELYNQLLIMRAGELKHILRMELPTTLILTKKNMENNLKLSKKYCKYLEEQPEYGMGYHLVDIVLKDGIILKKRIILNSTFLKLNFDEKITNSNIKEIKLLKK